MDKKEITEQEWKERDWIQLMDGECIPGIKKTYPPDDGYHYIEATTYGDSEQKWVRAYRYE